LPFYCLAFIKSKIDVYILPVMLSSKQFTEGLIIEIRSIFPPKLSNTKIYNGSNLHPVTNDAERSSLDVHKKRMAEREETVFRTLHVELEINPRPAVGAMLTRRATGHD